MHRTLQFLLIGVIFTALAASSAAQTPSPRKQNTLKWKSGDQIVESSASSLVAGQLPTNANVMRPQAHVSIRFRESAVAPTSPQMLGDDVRTVKYEEESPTLAPISLAQNQSTEADDLFGDFDALDQTIDAATDAATDEAEESNPLDDLLETPLPADDLPAAEPPLPTPPPQVNRTQTPTRRPLSADVDDEELDGEVVDSDVVQDYDSYDDPTYVPRRRPRRNQPMTLGDILDDEDSERDCRCEKEYCRRMWQCNGGRSVGWLQQWARSANRDRAVRNAARTGRPACVNDFKCCDKDRDGCDRGGNRSGGRGYGSGRRGPGGAYVDGEYVEGAYVEGIYIDGKYIRGDGSNSADAYEFEPELANPMPSTPEPSDIRRG